LSASDDVRPGADVVAFAPHPDDLELGCGGTLIMLTGEGHRVGLVDLTRGEMGTRGTAEIRAREAEAGRQILGAAFRENLGFPDLGVAAGSPEQLKRVVEAIRRHRPRLVLVCSEHDRHPDHVEAARLVERACYVAGLAEYRAAGGPWRPARLLFYMGRLDFEPKVIVDVSAVFERKMRAAAAFQSQFFRDPDDPRVTPISEPGFFDRVSARFRHFGARIGATYGEPFDMREPLGLAAAGTLLGAPAAGPATGGAAEGAAGSGTPGERP
jgi:N-acetylglucosamine malate deacetylase 1